jgi:Cdc6-like AAA superfamily ATPase
MEYRTWLDTPGQILFCQGIPGAGKTFLTSVVIDHLTTRFGDDSSIGLAYIYCNFQRHDQQTPDQLFACILKQLAEALPSLPDAVQSLHGAHQNGRTSPSLQEILITLNAVIGEFSRVFIVIDALDVYGEVKSSRETLLIELALFQQQHGINLLVTSRFEPIITLEIEYNFINVVHLVLQASDDDILSYIEANLSHLPGPIQENRALRDFAKIVISEAADGM